MTLTPRSNYYRGSTQRLFGRLSGALMKGLAILWATAFIASLAHATQPLPFKIYDTHVHFVSIDFEHFPLRIPPVIPSAIPNPDLALRVQKNPTDADHIFKYWDENGVEGGVGVQYRSAYGTDNTYLIASAKKYAKRVVPVVLLDPVDPNTPYALRSMVRDEGVVGVRFLGAPNQEGQYPWLTSPEAARTWKVANELGIVVVIVYVAPTQYRPDVTALKAILDMARQYPKTKVVIDHFGWTNMDGAPDYGITPEHLALKALPNVYFKLSSINLDRYDEAKMSSADFLCHAVDVLGADRIMWGSDQGNTSTPYPALVEQVVAATARLTPREQRLVLRDTGKAVHQRKGK